jgi:hypothetical protein
MPRKSKPKPDNPEQFKRFIDTAREVQVDESPEALDRAFGKVVRPAKSRPGQGENARGSTRSRDRSR